MSSNFRIVRDPERPYKARRTGDVSPKAIDRKMATMLRAIEREEQQKQEAEPDGKR
jgi:hypothetical protein